MNGRTETSKRPKHPLPRLVGGGLVATSPLVATTALAAAMGFVAAGLAVTPAHAQAQDELPFPGGWEVRFDREGADMDDLYLVTMPPGYHVTTGPAMIAWHPDSVATGDYRIESEIFLFDPDGRREAFGFFVGGADLEGPNQRYAYFLLREGGEFLVKTRSGDGTATVHDWTPHPAIASYANREEGAATARNVLALEVAQGHVRFSVNGEELWSGDATTLGDAHSDVLGGPPPTDADRVAPGTPTDGVFGLRVNHGLNLHVTTISRSPVP